MKAERMLYQVNILPLCMRHFKLTAFQLILLNILEMNYEEEPMTEAELAILMNTDEEGIQASVNILAMRQFAQRYPYLDLSSDKETPQSAVMVIHATEKWRRLKLWLIREMQAAVSEGKSYEKFQSDLQKKITEKQKAKG